mmetsp:Transcript_664/g.658  ORF Transcript_664/g.658 Transcript_664/m.658 type:complete len:374 (+) Transcript_664:3-1124(+)
MISLKRLLTKKPLTIQPFYKSSKLNFSLLDNLKSYINRALMLNEKEDPILPTPSTPRKKIKVKYDEAQEQTQETGLSLEPMDFKNLRILNDLSSKINQSSSDSYFKSKSGAKVMNVWEKLKYFETNNKGKVINPYIEKINNKKLEFDSIQEYKDWSDNVFNNLKESMKTNLTPLEFNITQNIATEKPFTGVYCNHEEIGIYSCKVCTQKLLSNTHKYRSHAGWASFWNYLPFSINLKTDYLDRFECESNTGKFAIQNDNLPPPVNRLACSNCDSHIGFVFDHGPAPFFKQLLVNSASIHFLKLQEFLGPDEMKLRNEALAYTKNQENLKRKGNFFRNQLKENHEVAEYFNKNYLEKENTTTFLELGKQISKKS